MNEYTVILEEGERNWSAYLPDLPGCVVAGITREENEQLMREAIALHIQLMRQDGDEIPPPTTRAMRVAVA